MLTYNIAHGRGQAESNWRAGTQPERRTRLIEISLLIRNANADVVVLNEADFDSNWSGRVDQALFIADQAGYPYIARQRNIDVVFPFFSLQFGNAVLSRYPLSRARLLDLPAYSQTEALFAGKKQAIVVECEPEPGFPFLLIAVHLEHRDESIRVDSAKRLLKECESADLPVVLAGDFNSHPPGTPGAPLTPSGDNTIGTILATGCYQSAFGKMPQNARSTFPAAAPDRALDWIFATTNCAVTESGVINTTLSDHLPATATIIFNHSQSKIHNH